MDKFIDGGFELAPLTSAFCVRPRFIFTERYQQIRYSGYRRHTVIEVQAIDNII